MADRTVVSWLHSGYTKVNVQEWPEAVGLVEVKGLHLDNSYEPCDEDIKFELPVLNKEDFYSIVSDVEYVMGWTREEIK